MRRPADGARLGQVWVVKARLEMQSRGAAAWFRGAAPSHPPCAPAPRRAPLPHAPIHLLCARVSGSGADAVFMGKITAAQEVRRARAAATG